MNRHASDIHFRVMLLRAGFHGWVLAAINIGAIMAAYGIDYALRPDNQVVFQATIATLLTIVVFSLWTWLLKCFEFPGLLYHERKELGLTYGFAMLWVPFTFIPFHLLTQGYLTSMGDLLAIWAFQIPANLLAIFAANKILDIFPE